MVGHVTLHVSALIKGAALQVSDRWVTVAGEVWEGTFNKNIVLRTPDALISIGFAGRAFMGKKPMDEWAAEILWGGDLDRETLVALRTPDRLHGLSRALAHLVDALNPHFPPGSAAPLSARVHAVAVGWRIRHQGLKPCLITISNLEHGGPMSIRERTRKHQRYGVVQVDPPGWVSAGRLHSLNADLARDVTHEEREDMMISVLRELSGDANRS